MKEIKQLNEALRLHNSSNIANQPYGDLLNVLNEEFKLKGEKQTNGNEILKRIFRIKNTA